jgi:membrane-bound serine protease (ClpP class)
MLGAVGEVLAVDNGVAWALVHGERWKVRCPGALTPGQRVRVVALSGLTLDVCPEDSGSDPIPKGTSS